MALKLYTSAEKALKLNVKKILGQIPPFFDIAGEKLVEGEAICPLPYPK